MSAFVISDIDLWWSIAPSMFALLLVAVLYVAGYRATHRKIAVRRAHAFHASRAFSASRSLSKARALAESQTVSEGPAADALYNQAVFFVVGWVVLAVSVLPPLPGFSLRLFSAHMVQHLLLIVAALFFVVSHPIEPLLFSLPTEWRRDLQRAKSDERAQRYWSFITKPLSGFVVFAVVVWSWHIPTLFEGALQNAGVHLVQHVCLFLASIWLWLAMLSHAESRTRRVTSLYLFATALHTGVLGMLFVSRSTVLYPAYVERAAAAVSPLRDQWWAGVALLTGGCALFVFVALVQLVRSFGTSSSAPRSKPARRAQRSATAGMAPG